MQVNQWMVDWEEEEQKLQKLDPSERKDVIKLRKGIENLIEVGRQFKDRNLLAHNEDFEDSVIVHTNTYGRFLNYLNFPPLI